MHYLKIHKSAILIFTVCFCGLVYFISRTKNLFAQGPQQMFWALNKNNLLLDAVPNFSPSVAYSVRRLRRGYNGYAIRVRKQVSGTDPIGDVLFDVNGFVSDSSRILVTTTGGGFTSGVTYPFSTFISGGDVFVQVWYDQSGNGNNANQTTLSNQPQIVSSGALITENGRASINFNGPHGSIRLLLATSLNLSNGILFGVCRPVVPGTTCGIAENGTYSYNLNTFNNSGLIGVTHYGVADVTSSVPYATGLNTMSWAKSNTASFVEINTRSESSTAAINIPIAISQVYGNTLSGNQLRISEFIVGSYLNSTQRNSVFENQRLVFKTP